MNNDGSVFVWIMGGIAFYFCALALEHQKPCADQRTNQLTEACRIELG